MENLFLAIRQMTADARMISFKTTVPQYQVQQVKNKLFLVPKTQNKGICDWWLRLYQGEFEKKDVQALIQATEGKWYMIEDMKIAE